MKNKLNARLKARLALADVPSIAVLDDQSLSQWAPKLGLARQVLPCAERATTGSPPTA
jgi:hypothetical protein